uniref:Uncharacterized protein n=1 Tax=Lygus hesperus TaxID=30085 RepID=A0A146M555_LYGHE
MGATPPPPPPPPTQQPSNTGGSTPTASSQENLPTSSSNQHGTAHQNTLRSNVQIAVPVRGTEAPCGTIHTAATTAGAGETVNGADNEGLESTTAAHTVETEGNLGTVPEDRSDEDVIMIGIATQVISVDSDGNTTTHQQTTHVEDASRNTSTDGTTIDDNTVGNETTIHNEPSNSRESVNSARGEQAGRGVGAGVESCGNHATSSSSSSSSCCSNSSYYINTSNRNST